jgi:homoserine O-acetyltransferase
MLMILAALAAQALQAPATRAGPPSGWGGMPSAPAKVAWPTREGDVVLRNFRFRSGETLPQLRVHYTTLGSPHRNAAGAIDNAVMVLHGTGGDGKQFLRPQFADELYGPGQPLDIRRYWIILPDNIGHGKSSKPSDGLRMRFPKYDYDDMVEAQHRMLAEGLGVTHLRLIMGTSMGCMHSFVWGETYPGFASALMPLACEPVEIAGLNRMWRQLAIDGIEADPAWDNGNYRSEPKQGLRTAESLLFIAGSAPLYYQAQYPTRPAASAFAEERVASALKELDANDLIYQLDASRNYNPWPRLERITAPVTWINSADDFINARNLPFPELALRRMPNARFRLIPETADTRGHGTHTWAKFWKADLISLLARSEPAAGRKRKRGSR